MNITMFGFQQDISIWSHILKLNNQTKRSVDKLSISYDVLCNLKLAFYNIFELINHTVINSMFLDMLNNNIKKKNNLGWNFIWGLGLPLVKQPGDKTTRELKSIFEKPIRKNI